MAGLMNFVYWISAIFIIRTIDFTNENNVWMLRCMFASVQSLVWLMLIFLAIRVSLKNNPIQVTVFETSIFAAAVDEQKKTVMSVKQYHMSQLQAMMYKIGLATVIVCGIHYKWELMPPLVMQCIMNPSQIYSSPLFKIHVMGESEADHTIPWEVQKPFPTDISQQFQPEARHKKKVCVLPFCFILTDPFSLFITLKQQQHQQSKEKALSMLREQNRRAIKSSNSKKES